MSEIAYNAVTITAELPHHGPLPSPSMREDIVTAAKTLNDIEQGLDWGVQPEDFESVCAAIARHITSHRQPPSEEEIRGFIQGSARAAA